MQRPFERQNQTEFFRDALTGAARPHDVRPHAAHPAGARVLHQPKPGACCDDHRWPGAPMLLLFFAYVFVAPDDFSLSATDRTLGHCQQDLYLHAPWPHSRGHARRVPDHPARELRLGHLRDGRVGRRGVLGRGPTDVPRVRPGRSVVHCACCRVSTWRSLGARPPRRAQLGFFLRSARRHHGAAHRARPLHGHHRA